jgi:hypothetical protein
MDMGEAVNPLTREMRDGGAQVLILRLRGFLERGAHYVQAFRLQLVGPVNQLAIVVDVPLHFG